MTEICIEKCHCGEPCGVDKRNHGKAHWCYVHITSPAASKDLGGVVELTRKIGPLVPNSDFRPPGKDEPKPVRISGVSFDSMFGDGVPSEMPESVVSLIPVDHGKSADPGPDPIKPDLVREWEDIDKEIVGMLEDDVRVYGNAYVSAMFPFTRFLVCKSCDHRWPLKDATYRWIVPRFEGFCPKCRLGPAVFKVVDRYRPGPVRMKRWAPNCIELVMEHGQWSTFYRLPESVRDAIRRGDRSVLERVPKSFLHAHETGGKVQLNQEWTRRYVAGEPVAELVGEFIEDARRCWSGSDPAGQRGYTPSPWPDPFLLTETVQVAGREFDCRQEYLQVPAGHTEMPCGRVLTDDDAALHTDCTGCSDALSRTDAASVERSMKERVTAAIKEWDGREGYLEEDSLPAVTEFVLSLLGLEVLS